MARGKACKNLVQDKDGSIVEEEDNSDDKRGYWGHQIEFTLSCIGYSVGLGNIWRFPYLCMRNGGGAFLIPYFTFLTLCGMPLFFMELCLGQFSSLSPLGVWNMSPLFKGIGWGMLFVSLIISIYFNIIIAWVLYFLGMSFQREVPWKTCHNSWNTANCYLLGETVNSTTANSSYDLASSNITNITRKTAAEEFFSNKVLGLSDGIENIGPIKWDLLLCLIVTWVIIFLCLYKGIKTSGKVVYVTATLPYLLLTVLLVRGAMLPGSLEGIKYYIIPDFNKLKHFSVWTEACLQVFYSLGPAWGGLITMASYNKFHNNCLRDAVVVSFTCGCSSMFAGFAIFSIIGNMAQEAKLPLEEVITQGPGLAFIAYPEAISKLPVSPFWAVCFFLTMLTVGVDSQFGTVETVTSGLIDQFPKYLGKRKLIVHAVVCASLFLCGLPLTTNGGMYLFQILDWYACAFAVAVIALAECLVVSYVYGIGRFYDDICLILRKRISLFWAVLWCGIVPIILLSVLIVSAVQMAPPRYGSYVFPQWAIVFGWLSAMVSIVPLPGVAIYRLMMAKGPLLQRIQSLLQPTSDWGPQEQKPIMVYKDAVDGATWRERMTITRGSYQTDFDLPEKVKLNSYPKV